MDSEHAQQTTQPLPANNTDLQQTTCCIVGGGPAGAVLAYILARNGVRVTLLESHLDFDRDFRGDTLHPAILEVMDELGLADRLLKLPHTALSAITVSALEGSIVLGDMSRLHTKFPYITLMPQARFLDFLTTEAKRFPQFRLVMGARVERLVMEGDEVHGVHYRAPDGWHQERALLTVGADGRFSRLRKLGGFESIPSAPPMDVLWFRLPRRRDDPHGVMGRIGHGHLLIALDRDTQWQIGLVIPKDGYQQLHQAGIDTLRRAIVATAPEFADRVAELHDWKDVAVLSVEADHLRRWYRPGLLLIGDAAHVMSPIGGNGINYAVMDAVAAANLLTGPLKAGRVTVRDLANVQHRREPPTRAIQAIVNQLQERVIKVILDPGFTFRVPLFVHIPVLRALVIRVVAFGLRPEHVQPLEALQPHAAAARQARPSPLVVALAGTALILAVGALLRRRRP
jgi:2-polyprenyl-6-methoxyphenol hydroxylase-like FAD-dependent oxidoreductase